MSIDSRTDDELISALSRAVREYAMAPFRSTNYDSGVAERAWEDRDTAWADLAMRLNDLRQKVDDAERALQSERNAERAKHQWQDISTAPKDGTHILVTNSYFLREDEMAVAYWKVHPWEKPQDGRWDVTGYGGYVSEPEVDPTHWMPLPSPPEAK